MALVRGLRTVPPGGPTVSFPAQARQRPAWRRAWVSRKRGWPFLYTARNEPHAALTRAGSSRRSHPNESGQPKTWTGLRGMDNATTLRWNGIYELFLGMVRVTVTVLWPLLLVFSTTFTLLPTATSGATVAVRLSPPRSNVTSFF